MRTTIDLILKQEDVFKIQTASQTEEIRVMHGATNDAMVAQYDMTRSMVTSGIMAAAEQDLAAHEATQQEIASLKEAIKQLAEQMRQKDAELKEFIRIFCETRNAKKRKALRERTNALSAAYLALQMVYR